MTTTPEQPASAPKKLKTKMWRELARNIRDAQWRLMERAAEHNPLWFCVWNKDRRPTLADEPRHGLIDGMEMLAWTDQHPDWFLKGDWSDERYAMPIYVTDAGRAALAEREKYDMEPVYGGMVEPGWQAIPFARKKASTTGERDKGARP